MSLCSSASLICLTGFYTAKWQVRSSYTMPGIPIVPYAHSDIHGVVTLVAQWLDFDIQNILLRVPVCLCVIPSNKPRITNSDQVSITAFSRLAQLSATLQLSQPTLLFLPAFVL